MPERLPTTLNLALGRLLDAVESGEGDPLAIAADIRRMRALPAISNPLPAPPTGQLSAPEKQAIHSALMSFPYAGGPLQGAPRTAADVNAVTLVAWLKAMTEVLHRVAADEADLRHQHTRLEADVAAARRVFGFIR